jgi:hypothetical protein
VAAASLIGHSPHCVYFNHSLQHIHAFDHGQSLLTEFCDAV